MTNCPEQKVRIGFIGAGSLATQMHYPSLAKMADVEIAAICDLQEKKAKAIAQKYNVSSVYTDFQAMLKKEKLDAVYISIPPQYLFDPLSACLQAGLHTFIEKPPGLNTFQVRNYARMASDHGCLTMTAFNRRFIPMLRLTREELLKTGPITQAVSTYYKTSDPRYYGGVIDALSCDAIHAVDALRWMCGGEVSAVSSMITQINNDTPNSWHALVRFSNGACGILLLNWTINARFFTVEMHTPQMSAFLNPDSSGTIVANRQIKTVDSVVMANGDHQDQASYYGFFHESRHFIDCIKAGVQPETHLGDAVKTLELIDHIRNAAVDGIISI